MIQAAIFDLDGTLLDSMGAWDTLGTRYLRSLGKEPHENLTQVFQSMTTTQAAEYYREQYGVTLSVEEICTGIHNLIAKDYEECIPLKPGVFSFLTALKSRGIRIYAATSNDRNLSEAALRRGGVLDFFSGLLTCDEVGHTKDEPFIYRQAMAYMNATRETTVVFEDALYAARTAKRDGFLVAAVYDPYERNPAQLKALADYYIEDFSDPATISQFFQEHSKRG